MKNIIEEQNNIESKNYIFTQPHDDLYLKNSWYTGIDNHSTNGNYYSSRIIRRECSLSLDRKMALYKKFENILDGGSIFNQNVEIGEKPLSDYLNTLIDSKINAFTLRNSKI